MKLPPAEFALLCVWCVLDETRRQKLAASVRGTRLASLLDDSNRDYLIECAFQMAGCAMRLRENPMAALVRVAVESAEDELIALAAKRSEHDLRWPNIVGRDIALMTAERILGDTNTGSAKKEV